MKINKPLAAVVLFLFIGIGNGISKADAKPEASVFLTTDLKERKAAENFDCKDKIYAVIAFKDLTQGGHLIEAFWYRPDSKQQDYTPYEFKTRENESIDVWLWLKLRPAFGGKLSGNIDPSAGMGDYIGFWKVIIKLDNKKISRQAFYVAC